MIELLVARSVMLNLLLDKNRGIRFNRKWMRIRTPTISYFSPVDFFLQSRFAVPWDVKIFEAQELTLKQNTGKIIYLLMKLRVPTLFEHHEKWEVIYFIQDDNDIIDFVFQRSIAPIIFISYI